jgi:hypothetical protein
MGRGLEFGLLHGAFLLARRTFSLEAPVKTWVEMLRGGCACGGNCR